MSEGDKEAWLWQSIELLLFSLRMLGVSFYGHIDGSVLLSFSCSDLTCEFNCVQRCLSIVTAVASGCGPVVSPRTGNRLGSPPHE
jgi:hypothetical protein